MKVAYLHRKPFEGQVSIERVFRNVADALPADVSAARFECPYPTKGLRNVWRNSVAAASVDADVLHVAGDVHYLALKTDPARTVLTIHDLVSLRRLKGAKRSLFKALWYTLPGRRAFAVTAISYRTRDDLVKELPFLKDKVHVVPNPVDPIFRPMAKCRTADVPVLLQIGTRANKNLDRLLQAIRDVRCRLIVVGAMTEEQHRLAGQVRGEVLSMQGLSDDDLLRLYRQADLVTFASTYEGFGLPILEAQSVGRPVLTSNIRPMITVAGGAAECVDPLDVGAIRAGVLRILDDPAYAERLVDAGFVNARNYSPVKVAQRYTEIYESIAGPCGAELPQAVAA